MAENKPGPMRTVEEPPGFDNPPTDRIPVQGDLSDRRTDTGPPDRQLDGIRDERLDPAAERATDLREPADDSVRDEQLESPVERTDGLRDPADDSVRDEELEPPAERADDLPEPVGDSVEPTEPARPASAPVTIFDDTVSGGFRDRWRELQAGFVDDPANAVRAADELVDEIMRELAERRRHIEEQWRGGPDDTEDLRMVIQEYRAFFNQLLNS